MYTLASAWKFLVFLPTFTNQLFYHAFSHLLFTLSSRFFAPEITDLVSFPFYCPGSTTTLKIPFKLFVYSSVQAFCVFCYALFLVYFVWLSSWWVTAFSFLPVVTSDDLWNTDPLTNVQYQINSETALKWHQARKSCQQQEAELLSITELHEQTYLTGKSMLSLISLKKCIVATVTLIWHVPYWKLYVFNSNN